jgi:hypothetical protein
MKVKKEFHKLIEKIEDERLLKAYFKLLISQSSGETGKLWNELSNEEQG